MDKLIIILLSCFIFSLLDYLYNKYISNKPINIRAFLYNLILLSLSIFGSFELVNTVLPSIGIDISNTLTKNGYTLSAFTNDPTF